ncbi:VWA domain-containing protein [Lederbergia sp. NSJ-179]|uniref:vWA domain-containing protein n=1 Tax=Lederbergia sp. NSJ-179 TaxID=2931402 RepID=UPI001FD0CC51|nr:vWA domain-containing protein [Lederbergia sp. NSJ-179]MCJ7841699.1 VWA domain-containing protein [Lederbergia sp. NSJ-179]
MGLEFKYPILFVLLIPVAVVVFLFYLQAQSFSIKDKRIIATLRSLSFLFLIASLTIPQLVHKIDERNVVFVADVSASMKGTDEQMLDWISNSLDEKREKDGFAIVAMGKEAGVEQAFHHQSELIQKFSGEIDPYDTNYEKGIQLAQSILPTQRNGRVILLSDGNETAGDLLATARLLKQKGIVLDYVPIAGEHESDMAITEMEVPPILYEGETVQIKLKITSNDEKKARLKVFLNDSELIRKELEVKEGTNLYTFTHIAENTGLHVYRAEVNAEEDAFSENNQLFSVSNVKGPPRVLAVQNEDEPGHFAALKASDMVVDQITPELLPSNLSGFIQYDSILFDNISATDVGENKMMLIERAVKEFGVGFVMAGGDEAYGLGGYFKTPIEDLLPVHMEIKGKEELPSLGLVIVLDRSGSMEGSKLSLAKEAAARSVELLRDKDTLGFS